MINTNPFLHFINYDFFTPQECKKLIDNLPLLEWEYYNREGYKYEVSSLDLKNRYFLQTKEILSLFLSENYLRSLESIFETTLTKCCNVTFHRMNPTDYSLKHNDDNAYGEKVRLVYYLTNPSEYEGGEFYLFENKEQTQPFYKHKLPNNSIFGFKMTTNSFHEVKEVTKGKRVCLVITFQ